MIEQVAGAPAGRILLVDDEAGIVDIHRYRIQKLGYSVSAFTNAFEALEDFCENPNCYHAVITDLCMPEFDGISLARTMKSIRPDVPIILCTGDHSGYNERELHANGIDQVLYKPVSQKSLADLLARMLPSTQEKNSAHRSLSAP